MASRLTRLSLFPETTREIGGKNFRWSLLLLPVLVIGLIASVREVSRVERVLAAEGGRAARVIVYELAPQGEIRVPIEPGTDVFRVVVHAVRKGPIVPQPHVARLTVTANGEHGSRTDDLALEIPGTTARVNPEDTELTVSDPEAVNVDVHGIGNGELTIGLDAIEGADGVLVRVYRRDALERSELTPRTERLDPLARTHLARRIGDIAWDDLGEPEQLTLLSARWRKVAALPQGNKLVTRAIALAPAPMAPRGNEEQAPRLSADLRGDERLAFVSAGKSTLTARADGDGEATVTAVIRHEDGTTQELEGKGELSLTFDDERAVGVELTRSSPGFLSVRGDERAKIEPPTYAIAWRATPTRPVTVTAGSAPIVLRVTARQPMARLSGDATEIALDATIAQPGGTPETTMLRAKRARSIYDRYEARMPGDAPTNSAVFHLLVPAHATATLTPEEDSLDLSLGELDPSAPPRAVVSYPAEGAPPKTNKTGDVEWGGFVPRRPSNVGAFEPEGRIVVRVAHRLTNVVAPEAKAPSFRVKRPDVGTSRVIGGRVFDPSTVTIEIDAPGGEALVLPLRAFADEPLDLIATIDGETLDHGRRTIGAAERITTARKIAVDHEIRAVVVLGDDLPAGKHVLTFTTPPGKQAWVHLPWTPKPRPPGAPPPDPHWLEGDLED